MLGGQAPRILPVPGDPDPPGTEDIYRRSAPATNCARQRTTLPKDQGNAVMEFKDPQSASTEGFVSHFGTRNRRECDDASLGSTAWSQPACSVTRGVARRPRVFTATDGSFTKTPNGVGFGDRPHHQVDDLVCVYVFYGERAGTTLTPRTTRGDASNDRHQLHSTNGFCCASIRADIATSRATATSTGWTTWSAPDHQHHQHHSKTNKSLQLHSRRIKPPVSPVRQNAKRRWT